MNEIIGREVSRLLGIYNAVHVMIMGRDHCLYNSCVRAEAEFDKVFNLTYSEYYFSKREEDVVVIFKVVEQQEQTNVGQGF